MQPGGKFGVVIGAAIAMSLSLLATVRAGHLPAVVVSGQPDVPVLIDGVDARGRVVYGDRDLYRPGHGRKRLLRSGSGPAWPGLSGGYFPRTGHKPAVGRYEIEPPPGRELPPPAESYSRSWSTGSDPSRGSEYPPYDPPPVTLMPRPQGGDPRR